MELKNRFDTLFYDPECDSTDYKSESKDLRQTTRSLYVLGDFESNTVVFSGARGWKLFWIQCGAIMEKKCLQSYRSLILHSLQITLTMFFIFLALLVVNAWQGMKDLPALAAELAVSDTDR